MKTNVAEFEELFKADYIGTEENKKTIQKIKGLWGIELSKASNENLVILAHQIQEKVKSQGFKTLSSFIKHHANDDKKFNRLYNYLRRYHFKKNQLAYDILFKNPAGSRTNPKTIQEIEGLLKIELSDASEENLMILADQIKEKVEKEGFKTLRSFMKHIVNDDKKFSRLYECIRNYFKKNQKAYEILFKSIPVKKMKPPKTIEEIEGLLRIELSDASEENFNDSCTSNTGKG